MAKIDADKLVESVAKFSTDFGKFSTDLTKFLNNLPVDSPETQNKIDTAAAALKGFDDAVNAFDVIVNPPVVEPPPTEQP